MYSSQRTDFENKRRRDNAVQGRLVLIASGLGMALVFIAVAWIGAVSSTGVSPTAPGAGDGRVPPRHISGPSALATTTPTVTLTAVPSGEETTLYLPLVQKDIFIPGSLSIEEVYTTSHNGDRQAVFQPCQAVVAWIRMRNDADISQTASVYWQTRGPQGEPRANLAQRRQGRVPPGQSTWKLIGSPNLDAAAGRYDFRAGFTSGTDHQELTGALEVAGEPMRLHLLEAYTAAIDPKNFDLIVRREIVPARSHSYVPVRITDMFTYEDSDVVQITNWEGVKPTSYVQTSRFRPTGQPFGHLIQQWRDYSMHPGCVRQAVAYWPIDDWVMETPGRWHFKISGDGQPAATLYFTIQETAEDSTPTMTR